MNWESWSAFWDMGGNAFYVWGSYGVTALLVIVELVQLRARRLSSTRKLFRLQRAAAGRKLSEVQP
ncbi:MAG: heme exporter protein CcmD [Rhodocyclaceae bacterium]|nr:heme exporter protein CcmD [Rhodocyclaceae bacterium]